MASTRSIRIAAAVAVVLLLLPVLYVLSTGPVVYLCDKGIMPHSVFHGWCVPLYRAASPPVSEWLMEYWSWWGNV